MVRVYQPISGLRHPVVVDPTAANFRDVNVSLRCERGDMLSRSEASKLCDRVATLFENQGAIVTRADGSGFDDELEEPTEGIPLARTDLSVVLEPRQVHEATYPLSYALCVVTFTLFPAISEETFAQDVEIRDGDGFLLLRESLKGRLVRRWGAGPWAGNWLADRTYRDKDERITGDAVNRDLSEDMYSQLSQMLFNAKIQWQVLQESAPEAGQP